MKYTSILGVFPLVGGLLGQNDPQPSGPTGQAQLETHREGDRLTLIGHCHNPGAEPITLRYELHTDKRGPAGTSRNAQSGNFTVAPHQTATLSQTTINVASADFYRVRLRVLSLQGSVVSEDSLVHQPGARP
ncbi:curli-like amyloid fiber formation chaperone CsgH [Hymenobacter cellulosilyticus]|uniref:CsgH-like domain-containing protein n=1 Tax=Hymenobacter cellulosilyticus TaxID=2932248 RepID=A0A8T9Q3N6_9BACT|nr:curli-like amyloid fiber formation chaperone CsgH [Hymenobacter cellulosilyticus]UOQ71665.1 hypothetical protein MUN79_24145 [Hymenobacter cellulosilyticus]